MERISATDIERIVATISSGWQGSNGLRIEAQQRNGYTAVDLVDDHGTIELLHVGTKREVYTYLQGMRRALLITNRL